MRDMASSSLARVPQVEVRLIDTVSGTVLASHFHKGASPPILAVRQENWLIYSYWNTAVCDLAV